LASLLGSVLLDPADRGIGLASTVSVLDGLHTKHPVRPLFLAAARSEAQPVLE
tara:strand:- start:9923 stop:10081 length:159 start_codon:yes stop_codon:yes gene_type:complete